MIGKKAKESKRVYSIQEHHASHLHWDLRLEMAGVLKSWAIPKEPSSNPTIKRLAVAVEDHPLSYALFEGEIPEGSYGAGTVKLWDKGSYEIVSEEPGKKYIVNIKGKKLRGIYCLIKFKDGKNWLFFKKE